LLGCLVAARVSAIRFGEGLGLAEGGRRTLRQTYGAEDLALNLRLLALARGAHDLRSLDAGRPGGLPVSGPQAQDDQDLQPEQSTRRILMIIATCDDASVFHPARETMKAASTSSISSISVSCRVVDVYGSTVWGTAVGSQQPTSETSASSRLAMIALGASRMLVSAQLEGHPQQRDPLTVQTAPLRAFGREPACLPITFEECAARCVPSVLRLANGATQ